MINHLALDSTQINAWLECNKFYRLSFVESLIPIMEAKAFTTGKLVHRMMEAYYSLKKTNPSDDAGLKTIRIIKAWLAQVPPDQKSGIREEYDFFAELWHEDKPQKFTDEFWKFISTRFISYYDQFPDESFRVISVEEGFSKCIHQSDTEYFVLEGRLDLLLQEKRTDELFWVDHKSQERTIDYYPYSVQFLNYALATGARNGMVNYFGLQESLPSGADSFFRRQPMRFSRDMVTQWNEELVEIFRDIAAARSMDYFPKNRHACKNGLNRQCHFTRVCEQTNPAFEAGIKQSMFKKREPWSPWRANQQE